MFGHVLFIIFILILLTSQPAYAYIDPGTGSMLFSVVLCSVTTLYFLLNSLIIKIKTKLFSEKSLAKVKHKFVIYSEGKQYYTVFKPILDEFEKRNIVVSYYTSAQDDPVLVENYEYVQKEYIGSDNKAFFKLAFLKADVCLMTTPQLDVLQLKRSKEVKHYSHIMHSIGFSMLYRLFSLDYYDSVLCDAEYQIPMIREIEQKRNLPAKELKIVGSSYLDYCMENLPQRNSPDNFCILIAPSWGAHSLLTKFGEKLLDELVNSTSYDIVVRPHPQSMLVEKDLIENLKNKYIDCTRLKWDFSANNLQVMANSDILISDFSGIMLDYAFLFKKPFLYVDTKINYEMYDFCDLDEEIPCKHRIANEIGKKLDIDNGDVENIVEIINQVKQDENLSEKIEKASDYTWFYKGDAAKNIVDFLVEKQLEVSEK
ncbi:CDP-glycerol glycerophosphotransferase family protein [bacterium]|nr:CDP-glycerol glycerophosphotransferase family protein [bacterium]